MGLAFTVDTPIKVAVKKLVAVTVCPGPNIAYFDRIVTLRQMVDHIYGRINILTRQRPHMFIKEIKLNINYLWEQIANLRDGSEKNLKEASTFGNQLLSGVRYYRELAEKIVKEGTAEFIHELNSCEKGIREALAAAVNTVSLPETSSNFSSEPDRSQGSY